MSVVIVVESLFGNTHHVAEAIRDGIADASDAEVQVWSVADAPQSFDADVNLLVVGAPTHNSKLPSASTRQQAANNGAAEVPSTGIHEWISETDFPAGLRTVTFDTSVKSLFNFGGAAKAAAKLLNRRSVAAERGPSFVVSGTTGPLKDGELDKARSWGQELAHTVG